jgi:hypothetical protein
MPIDRAPEIFAIVAKKSSLDIHSLFTSPVRDFKSCASLSFFESAQTMLPIHPHFISVFLRERVSRFGELLHACYTKRYAVIIKSSS